MEFGGFSSREELQDWIDRTLEINDALAHRALFLILELECGGDDE